MGNQGKLFKNGLRPVYRSTSNMKWKRIHGQLSYKFDKSTNQFILNWTHSFENIKNSEDEVFFAYTYPYSYTESLVKT